MSTDNLTDILIPTDSYPQRQADNGVAGIAQVEAIFRDHRRRLIELIHQYPCVVGCVAWLTDLAVLEALSTREHVSIVVQKEDFLKPDSLGNVTRLRRAYDILPDTWRMRLSYTAEFSYCTAGDGDTIRCVGNHNAERKPAFPRMHNKFLVFFSSDTEVNPHTREQESVYRPKAVWTGSYNISDNATRSWENAVLITNTDFADAYAKEFAQIFALSEPLDWTTPWVEPTYRIGS